MHSCNLHWKLVHQSVVGNFQTWQMLHTSLCIAVISTENKVFYTSVCHRQLSDLANVPHLAMHSRNLHWKQSIVHLSVIGNYHTWLMFHTSLFIAVISTEKTNKQTNHNMYTLVCHRQLSDLANVPQIATHSRNLYWRKNQYIFQTWQMFHTSLCIAVISTKSKISYIGLSSAFFRVGKYFTPRYA